LLWLNNEDLRRLPLIERKKRLEKLVKKSNCRELLYAHHIEKDGVVLFEAICVKDLEGIVAKRKNGIYRNDGKEWMKIKNPNYSQAEGRHDLLKRK
jgi:ATP-dependent DNA ligase